MKAEMHNRRIPENATAKLISPYYESKTKSCVQFYYYMYGKDINTLAVYINGNQEFSRHGNQNNTWHMGQVEVKNPGRFQVSVIFTLCLLF